MKVIRDTVAEKAGVSSATVSRTFNYPDKVSNRTRERVLNAAEQLGYSVNKSASSLRSSRAGNIIFLTPVQTYAKKENKIYKWFFADIIIALERKIKNTVYRLEVFPFSSAEDINILVNETPCDGVITNTINNGRILEKLCSSGMPSVFVNQYPPPVKMHSVYIDTYAGAGMAAKHLIQNGYQKPAHISGDLDFNNICKARWHGFRNEFINTRVKLINGRLGIQGGFESGKRLSSLVKAGKIDSVFVVNDLTAAGVIQALREENIRIPEDIALIGYDNLPFPEFLQKKITTVNNPFEEAYYQAFDTLIEAIRNPDKEILAKRVVPDIVKGESV